MEKVGEKSPDLSHDWLPDLVSRIVTANWKVQRTANYSAKVTQDTFKGICRSHPDMSKITCWKCKKKGHYKSECPDNESKKPERVHQVLAMPFRHTKGPTF